MSRAASLAPPPPADELEVPQYSSGRVLALETLESAVLLQVATYWQRLKGGRRFPARTDVTPRELGKLLRYVTLLRVLDDDYEFRIVGDMQVHAYGESYRGKRLSDLALTRAQFAEGLKIFYDGVRMGGMPFGYRGWIGRDMPDTRYSYHELAYFPLGVDDETVDHILIAGVYVLRGEFQSE